MVIEKERIKILRVRDGRNLKKEKKSRETNKREIECSGVGATGIDWTRKRELTMSGRELRRSEDRERRKKNVRENNRRDDCRRGKESAREVEREREKD